MILHPYQLRLIVIVITFVTNPVSQVCSFSFLFQAFPDDVIISSPISPIPFEVKNTNNPQNASMDCPFCHKTGCSGIPGIRTHIRNYCQNIDKLEWRDHFFVIS